MPINTETEMSKTCASSRASHNKTVTKREPTVFVVDDEAEMLHSLFRVFKTAGLHAETFNTAAAFLEANELQHPGCLVLDLQMPGINGLELQQILRDRHCNLPIVMLTGYGDVQTAVLAVKAGAVDFLEKPFDEKALVDSVRHALALDEFFRESRRRLAERDARLTQLTRREREVMEKMLEGKTSKATASLLGVSIRTVEGAPGGRDEKNAGESSVGFATTGRHEIGDVSGISTDVISCEIPLHFNENSGTAELPPAKARVCQTRRIKFVYPRHRLMRETSTEEWATVRFQNLQGRTLRWKNKSGLYVS